MNEKNSNLKFEQFMGRLPRGKDFQMFKNICYDGDTASLFGQVCRVIWLEQSSVWEHRAYVIQVGMLNMWPHSLKFKFELIS